MVEKIGVYVCFCGPNIKNALDVAAVVKHAGGLKGVVRSTAEELICSADGRQSVENDIRKHGLTRVVFAGCSPKEHEHTFHKIMEKAGLNPFLMQIANVREQCAWITPDRTRATQQAKAIVTAAVERVLHHQALEVGEIKCRPDVLVVGAGVTGISAALGLAQEGRRVYLVEKSPSIGGKVALHEDLFPDMACAACVIESELDAVLHSDRIETITLAQVAEVQGYFGNFVVGVEKKARFVDEAACIGCGACLEACPVAVKNEFNQGMDTRKAVYLPHPGALPNLALIDNRSCLRFQGKTCSACQDACPFGAIAYDDRDERMEIRVGAVVVACGFDTFDPWASGVHTGKPIENVLTGTAFERLVNSSGPTGGNIVLKAGRPPGKMGFVLCAGSRSQKFNEYCSGICCQYALKHAHQARQQLPGAEIYVFYADMCLPGREAQQFYGRVLEDDGIRFVHMAEPGAVKISGKVGRLTVTCKDVRGSSSSVLLDMVVLATAMQGPLDAPALAEMFDVPLGQGGFFETGGSFISPVASIRKGIFVAGCAQGPYDIPASIAQGQAAAGQILHQLVPGQTLKLEPTTARVDETVCCGCLNCKSACAFKAITCEAKGGSVSVNEAMCRGCGVCAAACPSGAITARHFTDASIQAEIKGLLK